MPTVVAHANLRKHLIDSFHLERPMCRVGKMRVEELLEFFGCHSGHCYSSKFRVQGSACNPPTGRLGIFHSSLQQHRSRRVSRNPPTGQVGSLQPTTTP